MPNQKVMLKLEDWGKFPLVTPVVIVTTTSKEGIPNAALKSWLMTIGGKPPLILFACSMDHDTAKNIVETKEFVVNVANNDIAQKALITMKSFPPEVNEIEEARLNSIPSKKVKPPSIKECIAHAECVLEETRKYEIGIYGNLFVGRVVYASLNQEILAAKDEEKYDLLDQMMAFDVNGNLRPDKKRKLG